MTRGRRPMKGLDGSTPVAMARGAVMSFQPGAENPCDFMITGDGHLVFVRVRKALCLRGTHEEKESEFCKPIVQLRTIPGSGPVLRELWIYSRYGTWRFFRVEDTGMVELCRDGTPLKVLGKKPAITTGVVSAGGTGLTPSVQG